MRVHLSELGFACGSPGLPGSFWVLPLMNFCSCFLFFSPLFFLLGSSCFLPSSLPPPYPTLSLPHPVCPLICLFLAFLCLLSLSWKFYTTDSMSPAPSTALPNPASRPSTPIKYWPFLPFPCPKVGARVCVGTVYSKGSPRSLVWSLRGSPEQNDTHVFRGRPNSAFSLTCPSGLPANQVSVYGHVAV